MSGIKFLFKVSLYLVFATISLVIILLLWLTLSQYNPKPVETLFESGRSNSLSVSDTLGIVSWNLGYAGLGANMDFFYEGGEMVRDSRENTLTNLSEIISFLDTVNVDFYFIQEIDRKSKRTYRIDEFAKLSGSGKDFQWLFATNYRSPFVPVPPGDPMGKVESGIACGFSITPEIAERHALPGSFSWPKRLFMLHRCFICMRYTLAGGKELVLINTHNSAYDNGTLKPAEIKFLGGFMESEYKKGNYVVAGGDWNQSPTGFQPAYDCPRDTIFESYLPDDFLPGWQQAASKLTPTNRNVSTVFSRKTSMRSVIDFFIVSPNISVLSVKVHDLNFQHSDHQPVEISFTFMH